VPERRRTRRRAPTELVAVQSRAEEPQAYRVRSADGEVTIERVVSASTQAPGVCIAWTSVVGPVELFDACTEPERAAAETDVVVLDPATGESSKTPDLEEREMARVALDDPSLRELIVRFNAPFWSLTLWPTDERGKRVAEFCGSGYSPAVIGMIGISAEPGITANLGKVEAHIRQATANLLGQPEGEPRRRKPPRRRVS
jgi:hypothetical protein